MDAFKGHKAVFSFRIDLDYFIPEQVMKVLEVAEKNSERMTWFINGKSSQHYPELIKRIAETQDVQNHGHSHFASEDEKANYDNIMNTDKFLRSTGIKPVAFSSPFGKWSEGMCRAVEKAGYLYSSEFRQPGKAFPFNPMLNRKKSKALQVPVHPVCEADLFYRGYSMKDAKKYFTRIIQLSYDSRIPIFLYGHPNYALGKYPEILQHIFHKISRLEDVWHTTLTQYAKFWIKNKPKTGEGKDFNNVPLTKKINPLAYLRNYQNHLLMKARMKKTGITNV